MWRYKLWAESEFEDYYIGTYDSLEDAQSQATVVCGGPLTWRDDEGGWWVGFDEDDQKYSIELVPRV